MKIFLIVVALLVAAWLGMWVTSTGILVSSSDTGVLKTRDCRYLVGVTVQKRLEPLAERCPFVRKVGR
ncbi:MAG TPA: hypothetical protein VG873_03880 [Burkholderiales bacterium]|nr:hypothetical protein [Burkholderiales bacterium]